MRFFFAFVLLFAVCTTAEAQTLPGTAGDTLTGKHVVVAQAAAGHTTILVAGFSHKGGERCAEWMRGIAKDPTLTSVPVYQLIMLGPVPGMFRGALKNMIRKSMSPADQERSIVLTQDEKLWRAFFQVGSDEDQYIVLLDASGKIEWSGHGSAADLEPKLRTAIH